MLRKVEHAPLDFMLDLAQIEVCLVLFGILPVTRRNRQGARIVERVITHQVEFQVAVKIGNQNLKRRCRGLPAACGALQRLRKELRDGLLQLCQEGALLQPGLFLTRACLRHDGRLYGC